MSDDDFKLYTSIKPNEKIIYNDSMIPEHLVFPSGAWKETRFWITMWGKRLLVKIADIRTHDVRFDHRLNRNASKIIKSAEPIEKFPVVLHLLEKRKQACYLGEMVIITQKPIVNMRGTLSDDFPGWKHLFHTKHSVSIPFRGDSNERRRSMDSIETSKRDSDERRRSMDSIETSNKTNLSNIFAFN